MNNNPFLDRPLLQGFRTTYPDAGPADRFLQFAIRPAPLYLVLLQASPGDHGIAGEILDEGSPIISGSGNRGYPGFFLFPLHPAR
jgi:hypothetical protein